MWPWELYEMLNLAAAVERAHDFDVIHYEAAYYPMSLAFSRLSPTPIVQTLHHAPSPAEVRLWSRYPDAPFVAISNEQARLLAGLNVMETVLHGIDTGRSPSGKARRLPAVPRTIHGSKGVLQAIGSPSAWACVSSSPQPRTRTATGGAASTAAASSITAGRPPGEGEVFGGARALLYPIQAAEPFGLVLAEAMACGTPVAALDRGAVGEVVDQGVTGIVFENLEQMANELPRVFDLDRRRVRARAVVRFGVGRMVDEYVAVYRRLVEARHDHRD
jgi:hypothetical protein